MVQNENLSYVALTSDYKSAAVQLQSSDYFNRNNYESKGGSPSFGSRLDMILAGPMPDPQRPPLPMGPQPPVPFPLGGNLSSYLNNNPIKGYAF